MNVVNVGSVIEIDDGFLEMPSYRRSRQASTEL